jgi:hypothetical protein
MTTPQEPTSPTIVAPQVLLGNHLKALKLPTFAREYEKVAMESARDHADYPRYLLRLCELEFNNRVLLNIPNESSGGGKGFSAPFNLYPE